MTNDRARNPKPDAGLRIVYERGRTWSLEELPPRSIALDGAVRGPRIDAAGARYSFDHHEGCVRHATLACCEQVYDALRVGLRPAGFTVFINDVDADAVLGAWLLLHPEALADDREGRLESMVRRVGRVDSLGPAAGEPPALMWAIDPPPGVSPSREDLDRALERVDAWWRGHELPPASPEAEVRAIWIEDGRPVGGEVRDGFRGLYERAPFGVIAAPAPGRTTAYAVGKASEFVDFDVGLFLERCNELEPGWGGGSTIGGAPRHADGTRSRLSHEQIGAILAEVSLGQDR